MDEGCAAAEDIVVYLGHDDCLLNDGQSLLGGETISFEYANAFPSELSVRVATCIDPTMPTTFRPASISIQAQVVFDKMPEGTTLSSTLPTPMELLRLGLSLSFKRPLRCLRKWLSIF